MKRFILLLGLLPCLIALQSFDVHQVETGDTWTALAYRYQATADQLKALNPHLNRQRQPAVGSLINVPVVASEQLGSLIRPAGSLLATAVRHNTNPWGLALENNLASPYRPVLYQPIFIPGGDTPPKEVPVGFDRLEFSSLIAHPGQAVAVRGLLNETGPVTAVLAGNEMDSFANGRHFVALSGTGAFFGGGQPELGIQVGGGPLWSQPWEFTDPNLWQYQQITLTGAAAEIDQESIRLERERLFAIWEEDTAVAQYQQEFTVPIRSYLEISSPFGARRSYNGGPYSSYHEGVDFSAYGGTPVYASAAGTVVVAEALYVRGGAVIIDHGLGIYSGYYHMSEVMVKPGDVVEPGQTIGQVGTTGLSTGNHLHWDLLVDGIWVDAQAWLEQDLECWILTGLGGECVDRQ